MTVQQTACLRPGDFQMTSKRTAACVNASATNLTQAQRKGRQVLLTDIGEKWHKFSWQELDCLRDSHDLVAGVVAKYRVEHTSARRDVDGVLKGRAISL
jgi:hypothetical protein